MKIQKNGSQEVSSLKEDSQKLREKNSRQTNKDKFSHKKSVFKPRANKEQEYSDEISYESDLTN